MGNDTQAGEERSLLISSMIDSFFSPFPTYLFLLHTARDHTLCYRGPRQYENKMPSIPIRSAVIKKHPPPPPSPPASSFIIA